MSNILITGVAGFIGFNLAKHLADQGFSVVGLDSISPFPKENFKAMRLAELGFSVEKISYNTLTSTDLIHFIKLDLNDTENLESLFKKMNFDVVLHLAGQTGVRYSVENPLIYIDNNVRAFCSLLEVCKKHHVKNLIYSSSSSVYGLSDSFPFTENEPTENPLSVYAASKKSDELIAHAYSSLHNIQTIGLRYFTVYGPWTRTNMAVYLFIKAINEGTPITLFNNGEMLRDFTYVGDVVRSIELMVKKLENGESLTEGEVPYEIFNIGSHNPITTSVLIETIEDALSKKAIVKSEPMQAGDMLKTFADNEKLQKLIGYTPNTDIVTGVDATVSWYLNHIEKCKTTFSYS